MTKAKEFSSKNWLVTLLLLVAAMVVPSAAWADEVTFTAKEGTAGFNDSEDFGKLIDGKYTSEDGTKWCLNFTENGTAYIIFSASEPIQVTGYSIVTGNDNASERGRNPKSWALYGCNDASAGRSSESWVLIDEVTNDTQLQNVNYQKYDYTSLSNPPSGKYQYFKMEITANGGAREMQMSELILAYSPTCDHQWVDDTVVAPTCTTDGYTLQKCSRCGAEQKINIVEATGHQWGTDDICDICEVDRSTPSKPFGDGSAENPYQIGTVGELYWFAGLVNGDASVCTGDVSQKTDACAVLTADITVNDGVLNIYGVLNSGTFRSWTPIGTTESCYSGTFDGNNHTISGLYFNDTSKDFVGLFGFSSGTIQKVGVIDSYFNGNRGVGGVCGSNERGTIQNCYNNSTLNGTQFIGGICGYNASGQSKILNCYNIGTVGEATNAGGVCGYNTNGTITNCYYLSGTATGGVNGADAAGSAGGKSLTQFASGEVAYLLAQGCTVGETFYDGSVWGQQLGVNDYPVLGSAYKLITTAYKMEDDTYWATFSDLTTDVTLSVPYPRTLRVYNATVSAGTMTLTGRYDNQVAMGEGVLLKTDSKYVNVKANDIPDWLTKLDYEDNNLVATPETAGPVGGNVDYSLYRLTYNTIQLKDNLGFYLGVATVNGTTYRDGFYVNATPGKAYLKVQASEAKLQSSAALVRGFAFPGDDGETTGVECISVTDERSKAHGADGIYDLQGRKVSKPAKGVYIKNGMKVFIK